MLKTIPKHKFFWLLSIFLLAGLTIIYFSDILFSDKVLSYRDLSRYYYPLRKFAFEQIKEGNFPFWNPYIASGHPLFATVQSVILYPISLIYLLPDFDASFNLFIILHIFLGGLFFYILMRDLKFSHTSSFVSATTFMFAGYLISVINLTTTLAAAVWFPLVFLFYNRAINKRRFFYVILSALFMGLMFLGGEPTPLYATAVVLGLYTFIFCVPFSKSSLRAIFTFLNVVIIFVFLFSFQLIPFIELIQLSQRTQTPFAASAHWSFPPRDIVNFVLPFFYGPLHLQEDTHLRQDWLLLSYLGIIPLILFFISLFFRRDEYANFFKLTFIVGLVFIFGSFTPIYKFFYRFLPGLVYIRFPVKFFFLSALSFSFLVGSGWEEFCSRVKSKDKRFSKVIKGFFIAGFLISIIFLLLYLFRQEISCWVNSNIANALVFSVNFYNLKRSLVFFILGSLFLFMGVKRKLNLPVLGIIISGLIFIDLYGAKNIEINPAVSKSTLHKKTAMIKFLEKDKALFRIYTSYKMNRLNDLLGPAGTYEEAFEKSIDHLASNRLINFKIYDARGYLSIHNLNYFKVLQIADTAPSPSSTNILNMLNVKYILAPEEVKDRRIRLVKEAEGKYLYENKDVLPRAYLVPDFIVIKDEMEIAERLKSKKFSPQREVILEETPLLNTQYPIPNTQREQRKEYVNILSYKPNEVIIQANVLKKGKFLVLADNYYPGWKVYVDGRVDKIYKANFTLRAVYIPLGRHAIKFVFDSFSFKIGVAISLFTLFILLLNLIIINRKIKNY